MDAYGQDPRFLPDFDVFFSIAVLESFKLKSGCKLRFVRCAHPGVCRILGHALAEALPSFSLSVIAIVAEYGEFLIAKFAL